MHAFYHWNPTSFLNKHVVVTEWITRVDNETLSPIIPNLDIHKATGADGLPAQFIRASLHMVRLITVLLNKCIDNSLVPFQWKQAIVTPPCSQV